jgi:hypothetical protein
MKLKKHDITVVGDFQITYDARRKAAYASSDAFPRTSL